MRKVAAGHELVISRQGVPVAQLVPIHRGAKRKIGRDAGRYTVPPDFNARVADDVNEPVTPISLTRVSNEGT